MGCFSVLNSGENIPHLETMNLNYRMRKLNHWSVILYCISILFKFFFSNETVNGILLIFSIGRVSLSLLKLKISHKLSKMYSKSVSAIF